MITISAAAHAAILAHAERAWPRECCGLLAGEPGPGPGKGGPGGAFIRRAEAARNIDQSGRADQFELDPQARFDLMRELDGGPEILLGHYHSHPNAPAQPSAADRAMAHEPDLIWLICAVKGGEEAKPTAGPVRAFRITGGPAEDAAVEPLDLIIRKNKEQQNEQASEQANEQKGVVS